MSHQLRCSSCGLSKSIYGQFCSECQNCGQLVKRDEAQMTSKGSLHPKKRKKRRILSTLDILISVFVVTPLVVACWRGVWQLLDIYGEYFPAWESFIVGTLIHILVGISQESFNVLVNRKHETWISNALAFLFMKLYTIVLNAVTNMQWRGGWIIIDEYFLVTHTESGQTKVTDSRGAVSFFSICFLIMFAMRGLRNLNSPPFEISLDYGDDMFLFPNMFKVKLTLFVAVSSQNKIQQTDSIERCSPEPNPENLLGLDSATWVWQKYMKPLRSRSEYIPKGFAITTEPSIYKTAFLHINPHKTTKNPRSIQDIIDSIMSESKSSSIISTSSEFRNPQTQGYEYLDNSSMGFKHVEPLYEYKPLHPGEINLLAPNNFRFAPTTWKSYSSKYNQNIKPQQFLSSGAKIKTAIIDVPMNTPISVMLNIYPVKTMQHEYQPFHHKKSLSENTSENNKYNVSEKFSLYILDVVFSIAVVTNLGIIVWRGIWLAIDVYFFPDDEELSAWGSTILAYVMVAIVFMLQPLMKKLCDNLNGIPRLLVADAYMIFSVIGVIFLWRGIWYLLNIYFIPDNEELSCWITHWVPIAILIPMGCSNSLLVRGVCLDCEEPDGSCVVFPCNYLKIIFDQEKSDTWLSIWTGVAKKKKNLMDTSYSSAINVINNYHIVNINDGGDDAKNNNVNKNDIS